MAEHLIERMTWQEVEAAPGVVGDATRTRLETGERMVGAVVVRIVQVCREMAGKG
jgi:creatinine amidohydrolase/Fe(II)-dependent formamide hydrolase-like protein